MYTIFYVRVILAWLRRGAPTLELDMPMAKDMKQTKLSCVHNCAHDWCVIRESRFASDILL